MESNPMSQVSWANVADQLAHYDEDYGHVLIIISAVFSFLSLVIVVLRFITKKLRAIAFHTEDYLMVLSWILAAGLSIEALLAAKLGIGQHLLKFVQQRTSAQIAEFLQVLFAVQFTYNLTHAVLKVSILLFYRTIFTFVLVFFRRAWYFVFIYVTLSAVTFIIVPVVQHLRTDVHLEAFEMVSAIMIALGDLMLLIVPMPVLWSLTKPNREKLMLCGLFGVGSITLISSIIRITYLGKNVNANRMDFTFTTVDPLIWSIVEVNLGIICACIPTVKPLWSREPKRANRDLNLESGTRNIEKHRLKQTYHPSQTTSTKSFDERDVPSINLRDSARGAKRTM